jgi:hypothetical protein
MAKKYTYSRTYGEHTFSAVEFDSFDEARHAVDKAIYDFTLSNKATFVPKTGVIMGDIEGIKEPVPAKMPTENPITGRVSLENEKEPQTDFED